MPRKLFAQIGLFDMLDPFFEQFDFLGHRVSFPLTNLAIIIAARAAELDAPAPSAKPFLHLQARKLHRTIDDNARTRGPQIISHAVSPAHANPKDVGIRGDHHVGRRIAHVYDLFGSNAELAQLRYNFKTN